MNQELNELYKSKWKSFSNQLNMIVDDDSVSKKPTNPLLIRLHDEEKYQKAEIRIMIVGQETNDWENVFYDDIEKISGVYKSFTKREQFQHKGFFKNHINNFLKRIRTKYPEKSMEWVWNNIVKVGKVKSKGFPGEKIHNIEKEHFKVFQSELEILKPNVVLFFTGDYDKILNFHLPQMSRKPLNDLPEKHVQELQIENVRYAFRMRHPTNLHFMGKKVYNNYYERILETIKF